MIGADDVQELWDEDGAACLEMSLTKYSGAFGSSSLIYFLVEGLTQIVESSHKGNLAEHLDTIVIGFGLADHDFQRYWARCDFTNAFSYIAITSGANLRNNIVLCQYGLSEVFTSSRFFKFGIKLQPFIQSILLDQNILHHIQRLDLILL